MTPKTKKFELEGVQYEITFPNVGQYLDIENMKMALTNNTYSTMLQSRLRSSFFALDLVDSISIMYILVPSLRKDLNVKEYTELDPFMAKKLISVYQKQIKPWYDELMAELLDLEPIEETKSDITDSDDSE